MITIVTETGLSALVTDNDSSLEPGGVEILTNQADWFHEAMELAMSTVTDEPNLQEVIEGSEHRQWKDAIESELTQIEKLRTWNLVTPSPNANIIPSMYTLRRKQDEHGCITQYKARLVAKEYK
jgi:hypothetical protein